MILNSRQFQEDICFDSCKEATTCGAVFLKVTMTPKWCWRRNQTFPQSGTCYLVAEDVALSGSMAPDPEATSYRLCNDRQSRHQLYSGVLQRRLFFIQAYSRGTHCFNNFIQAYSRGGLWCNKHQQLEPLTGSLHPRLQQYEQQQRKPRRIIFKLQIHGKASPSK